MGTLRRRENGASRGAVGGLTRRMVVASSLLALVVGAAFAVLILAIADLRDSGRLARHSREELAAADRLEKLLVDLETGQRGFVITREERFLEPWNAARSAFPEEAQKLVRFADRPEQASQARRIAQAGTSYIREYSVPLVNAARRNEASAGSVAATEEGKRRIDALRAEFDRFAATERAILTRRQDRSDATARRAINAATGGLAGSILLIVLFASYLARAIVWPVRRAAAMAGRLAGGDLGTRMPETGAAEIGALERAFNTLGSSLEKSRDELRELAGEQAALRRVATLVARRASPENVFSAVAEEVGRVLGADITMMARFEPDGTATTVAGAGAQIEEMPVGTRRRLEDGMATALVLQTGRSARVDDYSGASGPVVDLIRRAGICSSVGSPIVVEGHTWGVIVVSTLHQPLAADTEQRMVDFTELVATSIANAESRAQLAASRARIIATADETRRRIERDLHDGIQQRLVSLALDLRAAQATVPPELDELRERFSQIVEGLTGGLEELQEISRGIHPAILSEGGLAPALKTLARRSAVPVELDVHADRRLPAQVEVAAYYVVSEALTNAAKHAHATVAHVDVAATDGVLELSVRDDGNGGADPARGSGLIGLTDRVEALGGTIEVVSRPGEGTSLLVKLPVGDG